MPVAYWGQKNDPQEGKRGFWGNLWDNIGDIYRGVKHYGLNVGAWQSDPDAAKAMGGAGKTAAWAAALYAPYLIGGGSYLAGLGTIGKGALSVGKSVAPSLVSGYLSAAGSGSNNALPMQGYTGQDFQSYLEEQQRAMEEYKSALRQQQMQQTQNYYRSQPNLRYRSYW